MNGNQNQKNTGEQIKDALSEALQSGDFKGFKDLVAQTVTDTLDEVGKQIPKVVVPPGDIFAWKQKTEENVPAVKKSSVGKVPGILFQVFGGIGLGITGVAMSAGLFLFLIGVRDTLTGLLINLVFMAGFAGMIGVGIGKRNLLKRADRYADLCGSKMYGDIEKLARETGRSVRYVRRDIKKMLRAGIFPEGHLDEQKTCFMLSDTVYRQYLEVLKNRQIREEEEKRIVAPEQKTESGQPESSSENELNAMIAEGMECIRRLKELNENIEGEVISGKLFRLENLLKEIFDSVREHPEQRHRMRKPMDYYLPTTLKLVEAYEEFDGLSMPGEDILQAKAEIEKTLDIINEAFTELLNNLFQDTVFDVTTDAQVLKSMLAREGLAKEMEFT